MNKTIKVELTKAQRLIVAISFPLIILLLAYGILNYIDYETKYDEDPTKLDESWEGWLIAIVVIGVFEFFWFGRRNKSE